MVRLEQFSRMEMKVTCVFSFLRSSVSKQQAGGGPTPPVGAEVAFGAGEGECWADYDVAWHAAEPAVRISKWSAAGGEGSTKPPGRSFQVKKL